MSFATSRSVSSFDCKICYHPGKANVVADALSWKERNKPKRVRAMNMTLQLSIKDRILVSQKEALDESGVVCFGKRGKLAPRYVGPFDITERIGPVTYILMLPEELNGVHVTFYVSNLKKGLADLTPRVPLDEIKVDAKLNFMEEPVEILEREFKKLKRCRISIVKVRWNSKRGPEFTWECQDQMKLKSCADVVAFACVILSLLPDTFSMRVIMEGSGHYKVLDTVSRYDSLRVNSTPPLSSHRLPHTQTSPTTTPPQAFFYRRATRVAIHTNTKSEESVDESTDSESEEVASEDQQ
nr:putative reverse transcriptase domain-containing protein [Tanacetum cinerariifolium]